MTAEAFSLAEPTSVTTVNQVKREARTSSSLAPVRVPRCDPWPDCTLAEAGGVRPRAGGPGAERGVVCSARSSPPRWKGFCRCCLCGGWWTFGIFSNLGHYW